MIPPRKPKIIPWKERNKLLMVLAAFFFVIVALVLVAIILALLNGGNWLIWLMLLVAVVSLTLIVGYLITGNDAWAMEFSSWF